MFLMLEYGQPAPKLHRAIMSFDVVMKGSRNTSTRYATEPHGNPPGSIRGTGNKCSVDKPLPSSPQACTLCGHLAEPPDKSLDSILLCCIIPPAGTLNILSLVNTSHTSDACGAAWGPRSTSQNEGSEDHGKASICKRPCIADLEY